MKKIIFTLLLLTPFLLKAQNYTNICSAGPAFYKKLNTNVMKAYKATSYSLPGGGDTIFYTYATIHDTMATCFDTTKGSIFGRKVYRQSGLLRFLFFNKFNDTIYVSAKAQLNDAYRFAKLTSATYLEATVVAIEPDTVMGVIDDVLKIELQAKRNDGTPISNPWNGKYLKLSKHYGLSRTFDMTNVPFDTSYYIIVGKQHPVIGLQDFGWKDIYNLSIGDIFHYSGYLISTTGGPSSTWKEIQTVFSKTTYGANDSVLYKIDRCRSTVTNPGNNHVYIRDTILAKYRFTALATDSSIMRFPEQFKRENVYASLYERFRNLYNNRQVKRVTQDKYRFLNSCWTIPSGSVTLYKSYSEALGQVEYYRLDQNSQEFNRLVYFKKETEIWGTPVGTECSPLLDVTDVTNPGKVQVRIIPNPVKNQSQVIIEGLSSTEDMQFTLYNLVGREVYRMKISSGSALLDRDNLPAGLYVYTVNGKNLTVKGKLMIE